MDDESLDYELSRIISVCVEKLYDVLNQTLDRVVVMQSMQKVAFIRRTGI